ncbi:uncharacterized protein LAJ45_08287 [Morchella importuna]|uniref:Rhodopsin domain-containing protein n=1 Tax=Morchella conica CCBAS932 TaxID=1392247 RepID=A0A3N4KPM6_9PEZI|nr:uncharacterized protein LAJ45_08287 [Morchella importuna]KAH8147821.1 hypothetical protein LAJ45_08287 [Morchella importuna]RPB07725.1 hypothetical protein P167DRAFT_609250 [Morchella conica CCBAS932]
MVAISTMPVTRPQQFVLVPRYEGPADRSYITRNCNITLIAVSSAVVIARIYTRKYISNSLGLDDLAAFVALIFAVTTASLELDAINFGMGRQIDEVDPADLEKFFMTLPIFQLVTFNAVYFVRLSGVLFIRRLISGVKASMGVWVATGILTVQHFIFFFVFLLQCQPVRALWLHDLPKKCMSREAEAHLMYTHSGLGIGIDVALFAVPMIFVWKHIWNHKMRFRIALLLSVGSFVVVAGIIRLSIITTVDMGTNTTWNITFAALWTQLEIHTGLIMLCFPSLNPVFRRVKQRITGATMTTSFSGAGQKGTYPKPGPSVELYTMGQSSERRNKIVRDSTVDNESQERIVQPNVIHKSTNIEISVENMAGGSMEDTRIKDGASAVSYEREGKI